MDLFRRNLAPIGAKAWEEIEEAARSVIRGNLSARRIVDVSGPRGMDFSALGLGRLDVPEGQTPDEVNFGIRAVQPLVETRLPFDLDLWELDNADRGAKDIELAPLEEAAAKLTRFEEQALYHGFEPGRIQGLLPALEAQRVTFSGESRDFLRAVAREASKLGRAGIGGPYRLVVNPELWSSLVADTRGYPLAKHVAHTVETPVIFSDVIEGALLASCRGGDAELVLGHDLTVGYMSHDAKSVRLFLTESFTFRVIEPRFAVPIVTAS